MLDVDASHGCPCDENVNVIIRVRQTAPFQHGFMRLTGAIQIEIGSGETAGTLTTRETVPRLPR